VLSGLATYIDPKVATPTVIAIGQLLSNSLPQLPLVKLDTTTLTNNETARELYLNDPLVYHGGVRARFGAEFIATIQNTSAHLQEIKIPFLALHGANDRLVMPSSSEEFYSDAGSSDKDLKLYPDSGHELFEDRINAGAFFDDIIKWISKRTFVPPAH